jgi:hypothetical protein
MTDHNVVETGSSSGIDALKGAPASSRAERLEASLRAALSDAARPAAPHTRPGELLGSILIAQLAITQAQLERALHAQRLTGVGRLGAWLCRQTGLEEQQLTAALSAQWQCRVFRPGIFSAVRMACFLPRLLVEQLGALPLRLSGDSQTLSLCFEDRIDYELVRALERMHGIRIEAGLLGAKEFERTRSALLRASFPACRLIEATDFDERIRAMALAAAHPDLVHAHAVHVHGYCWLRTWIADMDSGVAANDLICPPPGWSVIC